MATCVFAENAFGDPRAVGPAAAAAAEFHASDVFAGDVASTPQAASREYETEVHFRKCYGVMAEIFESHGDLESAIPAMGFQFLDLGCAPGGFSSFLLEDSRCIRGYGVTLPSLAGGFPVRVRNDRFFLQHADLFELGPLDVLSLEVNVVIADAQYLRNNISWDEKYLGVRCRSKQHGVWALLTKQLWLGLTKLAAGGILIFRFGWQEPSHPDPATVWYKKCTLRLFTLLHDLFEQVNEVKSEYFNALQSSFYVCCVGLRRRKFEERQVAKLLGTAFKYLITTEIQDPLDLEIFAEVDQIRSQELDDQISEMLDRINKLRLINQGSRKWHQQQEALRGDPVAVVFLSPLPNGVTEQELTSTFSVYGRVQAVAIDDESAEASVRFAHRDHARAAATSLRQSNLYGASVRLWLKEEEDSKEYEQDSWLREWDAQVSVPSKQQDAQQHQQHED